jgi:hypothetical protein
VTAATASGHLGRLLEARFVVCEPRGRHRYYRLADAEVAHALEAIALVAERDEHDRAWAHPERQRLRYARCCYGHLAGQLAVSLFDALQREERLMPTPAGFDLTESGRHWLHGDGDDAERAERAAPIRLPLPRLVRTPRPPRRLSGGRVVPTLHEVGLAAPRTGRAVDITVAGQRDLLPCLA